MNSGKIVAVGPGARDKDGKFIPLNLKEGDTVLLPEYGGTEVKLGEKELVSFFLKKTIFVYSHRSSSMVKLFLEF